MATTHTPEFYGDRTYQATDRRRAAQIVSALVGVVFLLVGIAGFTSGLTDDVDQLEAATTDSQAMLLGTFQVSVLHNVVHLAFGVLGLLAAASYAAARTYLIAGGILYLGLTLYGALIDMASEWNFLPLNEADNWLHLGLGGGMVLLGLLTARRHREPMGRPDGRAGAV